MRLNDYWLNKIIEFIVLLEACIIGVEWHLGYHALALGLFSYLVLDNIASVRKDQR